MTGLVPPDALSLVVWFLAGLVTAVALVPACRAVAVRTGHVAAPRSDRWHRRPTALFGGVAIVVSTVALVLVGGTARDLGLPLVAGVLIFIVGLTDDILSLKPSTKLIAEIALAALFVFLGYGLHWTELPALDMLLTMVWLVGVTNAFNLLDNMDGLCGGVALIAGVALLAGLVGRPDVAAETRYLAILLGATAGFLVYNVHPASIFMGDAGSLFLGLTLSSLTLSAGGPAHDRSRVLSVVAAPMLVLLIPIFDTTLVTVSRILSGRPVSMGGRDHSSHRLVAIGLSEAAAVRVLWVLAAAGGTIGFVVRRFADDRTWVIGAVFILAMVVFAVYLAQVRVYGPGEALPSGRVTPVIVNFMYKRRVAEVLLDVCLVAVAYYAAWRLRFEGPEWAHYSRTFLASLPIAVAAQTIALFVLGAYRGAWRHFGLMDAVVFAKSVAVGTGCIIITVLYLYRFENYSRGVFVIYSALLLLFLSGSRASFRLISEFANRRRSGLRLAIVGSSDTAGFALRALLTDSEERYRMVGFVNEDPATHSLRLQGYPVLGGCAKLLRMIDDRQIDVVAIGDFALSAERRAELERACIGGGVSLLQFSVRLETLVPPS